MEFKNLFVVAVAAGLMAGCATTPVVKESPTFEPVVAAGAKDPNPFADYGPAMQSSAEFPLTVNWQDAHKGEIAAATSPETLRSLLRKDGGKELLNELRGPYSTDPIVMQQIAAMSQFVMDPARNTSERTLLATNAPDLRTRWTEALIARINTVWALDFQNARAYCALFCLDQLRWCARPEDAKALREIAKYWNNGDADDTRHVREFAAQVEREIAR